MKIIGRVVFGILIFITIYLSISLYVDDMPFPAWYTEMQDAHVKSVEAHDPFLNLGNYTMKVVNQRDSLQHLVDSLMLKK